MPLFTNSKNTFTVEYFDSDGIKIPASSVAYAKYEVFIDSTCYSVDTVSGITVNGDDFIVTIDSITLSGNAIHQFSVGDSAPELEPPIFNEPIQIIGVERC